MQHTERKWSLYQTLNIERSATADDIKRAYRHLAKQRHPDKEGGSEQKFKELCAAYDVLRDPNARKRYDRLGDAGFFAPPAAAEHDGDTDVDETLDDLGDVSRRRAAHQKVNDVLRAIFSRTGWDMTPTGGLILEVMTNGVNLPFVQPSASTSTSTSTTNVKQSPFFVFGTTSRMPTASERQGDDKENAHDHDHDEDPYYDDDHDDGDDRSFGREHGHAKDSSPQEFDMPVTLFDLYTCAEKKLRIHTPPLCGCATTRYNQGVAVAGLCSRCNAGLPASGLESFVSVPIRPGHAEELHKPLLVPGAVKFQLTHHRDTRSVDLLVRFREQGDETGTFTRKGVHLHVVQDMSISLVEALCGFKRALRMPDGQLLQLSPSVVPVRPGHVMVLRGYGLPKRDGRTRGNLYIRFRVEFPTAPLMLSAADRLTLQRLLQPVGTVPTPPPAVDNAVGTPVVLEVAPETDR